MAETVIQFKKEAPPQTGGFVETDTARAIARALRRAKAKSKLTMVAGAPGSGKTDALHRFRSEAPDMLVYTAVSGEGGVFNLACGLCDLVGVKRPKSTDVADARRRIAAEIGPGGFLIIDEAQYLVQRNPKGRDNPEALDWARGVAEEGFFGLALVGDLSLRDAVADMPQLDRRAHPRVVVESVPQEDVAALCQARGLTDPKVIAALAIKARRLGGLGYVEAIHEDARDMSDTGTPALEDYLAAMKLFEEGCR
jgi:hypothetical protein